MIQVSSRSMNGSIKKFRVHDLIRDLAMNEAEKENFMTVLPKPQACNNYPGKGIGGIETRRVSVQSTSDCSELIKHISPHTRSFFWFLEKSKKDECKLKKLFDKCGLLRVVEIVGLREIELTGVDRLIHLKYLRSNTRVTFPDGCCLGRLRNLETISLGCYLAADVMRGIWTIDTLRHALFNHVNCPSLPPSHAHANLKNLQSLHWVSVKKQCQLIPHPNHSSCLNNLRKLGLSIEDDCWDRMRHLLGTLPSLLTLRIRGYKLPTEIVYPKALPNYENLQTLYLAGEWCDQVTALNADLLPPRLLSLTLKDSNLTNDPMPELGTLKSLKKLVLRGDVYIGGNEMICPSGFPLLQTLELFIVNIESFTVVEGVMLNLKSLKSNDHMKLLLPPVLKHSSRC